MKGAFSIGDFILSEKDLRPYEAAKRRGSILPISENPYTGAVSFDSSAGVVGSVLDALTLPGRAYRGEAPALFDEITGRPTEAALGEAMNFAGAVMGGAFPIARPANSIGMFAGREAMNLSPARQKAYDAIDSALKAGKTPSARMLEDAGIQHVPGVGYGHYVDTADWGLVRSRPRAEKGPLDKILDAPGLYAAYPRLRRLPADINPLWEGGVSGSLWTKADGGMPVKVEVMGTPRETIHVLRHELGGHAVDSLEGRSHLFTPYNPSNRSEYLHRPAEVNARRASNAVYQGANSGVPYARINPWVDPVVEKMDRLLKTYESLPPDVLRRMATMDVGW